VATAHSAAGLSAASLTVIVPARDAAATLPETLAGLREQDLDEELEVVVVDDGSRDRTGELARRSPVVNRVIELGGRGPGQARNAGAAVATAAKLAFLDADCRPIPAWARAGLQALEHADLVLGETRPRPDRPLGPYDRTLSVVGCSPLFESANLFVDRELFEGLAGFESWLGPRRGKELGEDVWLGWRAIRSGARIAAAPDALVHHEVFPRSAYGFIAERWRLRFFPAMAARMPELRATMFHHHLFLNRRSARFDLALAGLAAAAATRRSTAAAAALPYLHILYQDFREPQGAQRALARLGADAIGLAGLTVGSLRYRSLVL
jgi:glycosyltransferase involved in cell wall biosynthesis